MKSAEQPASPPKTAEQAEVVAEHHDRIEFTELATDPCHGTNSRIQHSAQPARLHRERRVVDSYDLVTVRLQVQCNPSRPGADIQDAAADVSHGSCSTEGHSSNGAK